MSDTTSADLVRLMVGRELSAIYPKLPGDPGRVAFRAEAVRSNTAGFGPITLEVRSGEILGLGGLVGSGRTEFAETVFGLRRVEGGRIQVKDQFVTVRSPADAMQHGIAYLPEDRRRHGVVLDMSVAQNATLASLPSIAHRGFLRFDYERDLAADYVRKLLVKTSSISEPVRNLSGGNQQKVALSRWLLTNPSVLILDEPTQGIDVGAKAEIYSLIAHLAASGVAILMISSDMNELLGMSDRIAILSQGSLAGILDRSQATPVALMELALGHHTSSHTGAVQ